MVTYTVIAVLERQKQEDSIWSGWATQQAPGQLEMYRETLSHKERHPPLKLMTNTGVYRLQSTCVSAVSSLV